MTGANVIVNAMIANELKRIYVFPGGTIAPVLDLAIMNGIEIFCARHEQGAGYAALAAARLTGKPQIVMVTSGPGVTNVITPVADAYFDSSPLLVLTGQVGTGDMRGALPVRQRGFQEVDTVALLRPLTKAQFSPRKPDDLQEIMESAFEIAVQGRPGPVLVDLPMDVQRGEVKEYREVISKDEDPLPDLSSGDIEQVVDWLLSSNQPVILAGQGVLLARAHSELRRFAERCRVPVSQSLLALGAFPTASTLALGFHGHTGNQYAGRAIHESDLLLVIGSRLDVRQTGSRVDAFVPGGRVVRIDLDSTELDHSRVRSDMKIRADAKSALLALNAAIEKHDVPDWSSWHAQIEGWRKEYALTYEKKGVLKPQYIIETANRLSKDQALVAVSGVGSHQQWVARHFDFDFPQRAWLTSGGHGAMGFDLPVAVGAQLTRPDVPVFCFVGDGSLQMNIQELASIIEYKLPIKIIVLDNHRLGIVSQFQNLNWGSDPTCGDKWNPDFAAIGRAYGLTSFTIDSASQAEPILKKALAEPGPVLVHCIVDPAEDVTPMLLAGQTMDKMWPYA